MVALDEADVPPVLPPPLVVEAEAVTIFPQDKQASDAV